MDEDPAEARRGTWARSARGYIAAGAVLGAHALPTRKSRLSHTCSSYDLRPSTRSLALFLWHEGANAYGTFGPLTRARA